jgi:hypothetical protein
MEPAYTKGKGMLLALSQKKPSDWQSVRSKAKPQEDNNIKV